MLRSGPYGDGYGATEGISLATVRAHPHGLVVGSLEPRLPGALRTESGRIELAPPALVDEIPKLVAALSRPPAMQLIGRRDLRTNNSWMHNVGGLARGKDRSRLLVHPDDAATRRARHRRPGPAAGRPPRGGGRGRGGRRDDARRGEPAARVGT